MQTTYKPTDEQEVLTTETDQEETAGKDVAQDATEQVKPTQSKKRDIYFDVAGGYL